MKLILQNHSSYPRDLPSPRPERAHLDEILHEQAQTGIDVATDGQLDWPDPISHVMGKLDGVRIAGEQRYFDTDSTYRQPVISGSLRRRGPMLRSHFTVARLASPLPVKPVLPGPYTLARLCVNQSGAYPDLPALAHALGDILVAEVTELIDAGATLFQVDEPAILFHPEDIRLLRQLLEPIWQARGNALMVVATYFGDAAPLYAQLNSLPADILALDFTCSPTLADEIHATGASKILALGLIDGRNSRIEDPSTVARQVDLILKRYVLDTVHLLPSCGLAYLRRSVARAKLEVLAAARHLMGEHGNDAASAGVGHSEVRSG
jgi:5-methyltetrahydropteroyltriglutamate--homocysteine methyltransferase